MIRGFPSGSQRFLNLVCKFIMIHCQILACLDFRDISLPFQSSNHQEEKMWLGWCDVYPCQQPI